MDQAGRANVECPEHDLLLSCATARLDSERAERTRLLVQEKDIDWSYLIQTSIHHGLTPLLYKNLQAICPERVPKEILNRLQNYFRVNVLRNFGLSAELIRILNLFKTNGIYAIPFKGPILAVSVYGDIALRPFHDLDILIQKQDILKAKELLASRGYQPEVYLTRKQESAYLQSDCEYTFGSIANGIHLDIHWGIVERYFALSLDTRDFWRRLKAISFFGEEVLIFSPEDLLLILCLHGAKHSWIQLLWVCDVAELIRAHPWLDWGWVMKRAMTLGIERMLFLRLSLANGLFGALLPEGVLNKMKADPTVKLLAGQVREALFRKPNSSLEPFKSSLFHLRASDCLRDKVRYFFRRAIRPTVRDFVFLKVPDLLFSLYYIIRPVRLGVKYSSELYKSLMTSH